MAGTEEKPVLEEPTREVDEPSAFSPSASPAAALGRRAGSSLPKTKDAHAEKMDISAIYLVALFAAIIILVIVSNVATSLFCLKLSENMTNTVLDLCKTIIIALLGYVFGSRAIKGGKDKSE